MYACTYIHFFLEHVGAPYPSFYYSLSTFSLFFFFLKIFIYLFIHERGRDIGRGRSRLLEGSLMQDSIQELWDHTMSQRQRCSTTEPPRRPTYTHLYKMYICNIWKCIAYCPYACVYTHGWYLYILCFYVYACVYTHTHTHTHSQSPIFRISKF